MDREKVIKGLEEAETMLTQAVNRGGEMAVMGAFKCLNHVSDALAILQEQEDLGTELTNAVELIHKKNERIEKLLKEMEAVVRCKDCKHRGTYDCPIYVGGDGMCSEPDDWFCADGERRS